MDKNIKQVLSGCLGIKIFKDVYECEKSLRE